MPAGVKLSLKTKYSNTRDLSHRSEVGIKMGLSLIGGGRSYGDAFGAVKPPLEDALYTKK